MDHSPQRPEHHASAARSSLHRWLPAAGLTTLLALFFAMLSHDLGAGRTHGAAVGSVLPYSDAGDYLQGAHRLLRVGSLDAWNSRRPLNAAFLAARLALTGESLFGAFGLQALLLAVSTWLAARALSVRHGRIAGALVSVAMLGFGGVYVATTMSESLGLSLGALALALLLNAAERPSPGRMFLGVWTLSVALAARSGPFFTLPMLLVWCWVSFRDKRLLGSAVGALVAGAAFNNLLLRVHHGVLAGTQSNFSYTLYGLSIGGRGWEVAWVDHPEITGMPEAQGAALIQRLAIENIRSHPETLALGLVRGFQDMVFNWTAMFSGDLLDHHPVVQWTAFLAGLAGVGVATVKLYRVRDRHPSVTMLAAVAAGMLLSVPVIYTDGRERVFAAAFPIGISLVAALVSALVSALRRLPAVTTPQDTPPPSPLAAGVTLAVLASALLLPPLGRALRPVSTAVPTLTPTCPSGARASALLLMPRGPRITLPDAAAVARFRRGIQRDPNLGTNLLAPSLVTLQPGTSLALAFELPSLAMQYLAIDARRMASLPARVTLCATPLSRDARHILQAAE